MECSFRYFLFLFHKKNARDSLTKSEFYHPVVELKSKMNGLRTWTASPGLEGEPQIVSGPIWPPGNPLTVAFFQPGPDSHALEFPFWLRPHKRAKGCVRELSLDGKKGSGVVLGDWESVEWLTGLDSVAL